MGAGANALRHLPEPLRFELLPSFRTLGPRLRRLSTHRGRTRRTTNSADGGTREASMPECLPRLVPKRFASGLGHTSETDGRELNIIDRPARQQARCARAALRRIGPVITIAPMPSRSWTYVRKDRLAPGHDSWQERPPFRTLRSRPDNLRHEPRAHTGLAVLTRAAPPRLGCGIATRHSGDAARRFSRSSDLPMTISE
jgi:hypothetical protein